MKKSVRKLVCLVIAAVVGCIPTLSVQAAAENAHAEMEAIQEKVSQITSDISEATPLEKTDIQDLVNYQINTYIMTEHEAKGKTLSPGEESAWIPLADLDGNCFAYLVPLVDQETGEIGYITMGAIEDGFTKYMLAWDTGLLVAYRELLDSTPEAVPVFFQPMQYGYLIDGEEGKQIFLMQEEGAEAVDITASVAENAEQLTASYQVVRSPENAARVESSLNMADQIQQSGSARGAARVAVEDVRLSCEWKGTDKFVPIVDNNGKTWYGGNQNWYEDSGKRSNGCGPVAASNVLYYMSRTDTKYRKLYPYSALSFVNFRGFMNIVYDYVNPAPFGEISLSSWASDVVRYASNNGVTLTSNIWYCTPPKNQCENFIKNGLKLDRPVGSLNLAGPFGSGQVEAWHWVTITKYFQSSGDDRWLGVSSMGQRRGLDWDAYYANMTSSLLDSGFAYFT